jgi:hypothetical protein
MTSERVPVPEYMDYCSDRGLDGRGKSRRKDNKQLCWGCGARSRKHGKIIEGSGGVQEQTEGGQRRHPMAPFPGYLNGAVEEQPREGTH